MNVKALATGPLGTNCYLVWRDSPQALVFDPGFDADRILDALDEQHLDVAAYICTHGHFDHICALADMHAKRPAPVAMHSVDLAWAFRPENRMEPLYPPPSRPETDEIHLLDRMRQWTFGGLSFERIETPGHTPGSCCLYFSAEGILIAGDTLFKRSCGRTDLPGGNPRQMKESLETLKTLPDETYVYPGHGPETTIGKERAENYYMR